MPSPFRQVINHLTGRDLVGSGNEHEAYVNGDGKIDVADMITIISEGKSLTAEDLDKALDALQDRQECKVILVIDAPYSGAFREGCQATGSQKRLILTSGRVEDKALFLASTLTSFSQHFLSAAYQGANLRDAFHGAEGFISQLIRYFMNTRICPQMSDTRDIGTDTTVSSLPEIAFTRDSPGSWTWTATFTAPEAPGDYTLTIYAAYPHTQDKEKLSVPEFTALKVR